MEVTGISSNSLENVTWSVNIQLIGQQQDRTARNLVEILLQLAMKLLWNSSGTIWSIQTLHGLEAREHQMFGLGQMGPLGLMRTGYMVNPMLKLVMLVQIFVLLIFGVITLKVKHFIIFANIAQNRS